MKSLGYTSYADLKFQQNYREREMPYEPLRHRDDGISGKGPGFGVGVIVPVGAGAAAAGVGALGAVVLISEVARSSTEFKRSKELNDKHPLVAIDQQVRSGVNAGLLKHKYAVSTLGPVKHQKLAAKKEFKFGDTVPGLADEDLTAIPGAASYKGVIVVNVVNYGVRKLEAMFKEDEFQPYVIVSVEVYRNDSKKCIHKAYYMGQSPAPLPAKKEFEVAIADKATLSDYYQKAAGNAVEMILMDLAPAW